MLTLLLLGNKMSKVAKEFAMIQYLGRIELRFQPWCGGVSMAASPFASEARLADVLLL